MGDLSKNSRGRWGERLAARHLERLGYRLIASNWRSPEKYLAGDLDLIALIERRAVICEVKTRRMAGYGGPVAAVTPLKQEQIRRLTESWLRCDAPAQIANVRFDVIAIEGVRLTHLEDAF